MSCLSQGNNKMSLSNDQEMVSHYADSNSWLSFSEHTTSLSILDSLLRKYDRRATPTNHKGTRSKLKFWKKCKISHVFRFRCCNHRKLQTLRQKLGFNKPGYHGKKALYLQKVELSTIAESMAKDLNTALESPRSKSTETVKKLAQDDTVQSPWYILCSGTGKMWLF